MRRQKSAIIACLPVLPLDLCLLVCGCSSCLGSLLGDESEERERGVARGKEKKEMRVKKSE
jgi:hypothetical protein